MTGLGRRAGWRRGNRASCRARDDDGAGSSIICPLPKRMRTWLDVGDADPEEGEIIGLESRAERHERSAVVRA
jgi:hypothetical protein